MDLPARAVDLSFHATHTFSPIISVDLSVDFGYASEEVGMPLPADFRFALLQSPTEGLGNLRIFYDRLPVDPYINGQFRQRRFSHFVGSAERLRRLDHMHFEQSKKINQFAGGVKRDFQELEDGFIQEPAVLAMVALFASVMGFDPEVREIGVHQIRIIGAPGEAGSPAPEGIHQDGFDYIGIFCVERFQILGATTSIYPAKGQPPLFSRELQAGEAVFANDRKVCHFAEQVWPSGEDPGHWDLLVITA